MVVPTEAPSPEFPLDAGPAAHADLIFVTIAALTIARATPGGTLL